MQGITIIIRTMGRPTLARAVASVQAQGRRDVTIVQVDAAGLQLDRSAAAQAGLDRVRTRWALFLDDDDELLPGHLDKLIRTAAQHPQAIAVHTGVEQVRCAVPTPAGGNGELIGDGAAVQEPEVVGTFDRAFEAWQLLAANHLPIHAVLFDAQRARAGGARFDPRFDVFEDWDFWLQLQCLGPFVHVPGVSARYWVASSRPEAAQAPEASTSDGLLHLMLHANDAELLPVVQQSLAQSVVHGQAPYQVLWRKWWHAAPADWWSDLLEWARQSPGELTQAREELRQTQAYAEGLALSIKSFAADAQAWSEQYQAEVRRHQLTMDELNQARADTIKAQQHADDGWAQAGQAVATVELIRQSRSWRYTAAFRAVGRMCRSLARIPAQLHQKIQLARHRSYPRSAVLQHVLPDPYQEWIARFDGNDAAAREQAMIEMSHLTDVERQMLRISVIMPVFNPPLRFLDEAIASLQVQWWPHWELCIADDASPDPAVLPHLQAWAQRESRIRLVQRQANGHISACSNSALEAATAEWVALFDQDDLLAPQALWRVVQTIGLYPQAGLIYSDEDKVDDRGHRFGPYFKPAFDLHLLRGQNMISHLGVYRRQLVEEVGGFRLGFEGSQDHDLALRCVERLQREQVVHIPRVLYHWRVHAGSTSSGQDAKPYALDAGIRAVQEHLKRTAVPAQVDRHPAIPHYRIHHRASMAPRRPLTVLVWGEGSQTIRESTLVDWLGGTHPQRVLRGVRDPINAVHRLIGASSQEGVDAEGDLLLIEESLLGHANWLNGGVQEWQQALSEDDVGAVAPSVRRADDSLMDSGCLVAPDGSVRPFNRHLPSGHHGYYGQASLAHLVSAAPLSCVLMRLEALESPELGIQRSDPSRASAGLVLRPGWCLVWNPVLSLRLAQTGGRDSRPTSISHAGSTHSAAHAHIRTAGASRIGFIDPAYSPHLSAVHPDHRIERDQSLRNSAAASSPRLPSSV